MHTASEPNSSVEENNVPKKSKAVMRLEKVLKKQAELETALTSAKAAVAAEDHKAEIAQGLNHYLHYLREAGPSAIEGVIGMVVPNSAPPERIALIKRWSESMSVSTTAKPAAKESKTGISRDGEDISDKSLGLGDASHEDASKSTIKAIASDEASSGSGDSREGREDT